MYEGSVQSSNRDPEDLLLCPYNDTHMIRAKRMPYHLMKCRNVCIVFFVYDTLLQSLFGMVIDHRCKPELANSCETIYTLDYTPDRPS